MECPHVPELSRKEFGERLMQKLSERHVPLSGSVELTFRCNLRCAHCYVACGNNGAAIQSELTTGEWYRIFDQLADEGCLWLLLTGGEPLARPDFIELYDYAKRKGFILTLFTNGTLLTPRLADHLAEWRPFAVEITLYGRTEATYERVTGIPGSYARCMRGIELLMERGIPLRLKTMLLTVNQHELWDMKAYAESLGVQFRFDPLVNAGLMSEQSPAGYRLSPEEILTFEMEDTKQWESLADFWARYKDVRPDTRYLYSCGAGLRTFHVDPYGGLSVCIMSRAEQYDLRNGSFHEGWHRFLRDVRYQPKTKNDRCDTCELHTLCNQCPGWSQMEHEDQEKPVDFLCRMAHLRADMLETGSRWRVDQMKSTTVEVVHI